MNQIINYLTYSVSRQRLQLLRKREDQTSYTPSREQIPVATMKTKFEVDTQSLSRSMALRDILNDAGQNEKITIGTSSWTPLENGRSLLKPYDQNRLKFLGTSDKQKADYIYTNYYYEVNPEYVKKYSIPSNFKLSKIK